MISLFDRISKSNRRLLVAVALVAITGAGFFLRTYRHDYLARFGKDQARDASIVRNVIDGKSGWPLLGPDAGETSFRTGPAYYYLEIASAGIFGADPPALAYPELLLSVAAIPMLFFLLRLRFSVKASLLSSLLYALSFYAVQNGRFAWNPNSLPLFSMLSIYAILKLLSERSNAGKVAWSAVLGMAFGIGIQLHVIYMLVFGLLILAFCLYSAFARKLSLRCVGIFVLIVLLLNLPQAYSEFVSGWGNAKGFIEGIGQKGRKRPEPIKAMMTDAGWIMQSGVMFVAPAGDDTELHIDETLGHLGTGSMERRMDWLESNWPDAIRSVAGDLLFLAGAIFISRNAFRKGIGKDEARFYRVMAAYLVASFVIYLSVAHMLELRYMLILEFVPFVMIGMAIDASARSALASVRLGIPAAIAALMAWNVWAVDRYILNMDANDDNDDIAIWGEEKCLGEFVLSRMNGAHSASMVYLPSDSGKFVRPLAYFDDSIDDNLSNAKNTSELAAIDSGSAYFSVILNSGRKRKEFGKAIAKDGIFSITETGSCGRVTAYRLEPLVSTKK